MQIAQLALHDSADSNFLHHMKDVIKFLLVGHLVQDLTHLKADK